MRRIHWWSGAIGAAAIATAACLAPTAMAARGPHGEHAKQIKVITARHVVKSDHHYEHRSDHPKPPVKPVVHHHHHHHGEHGEHGEHGCAYPPSGTAQVSLSGPNHSHPTFTVTLAGTVKINACGYEGFATGLYTSNDGKTGWTQVLTTTSDPKGTFGFKYPADHSVYLRAVVAGGAGYGTAESPILFLPVRPHHH